MFDYQRRLRDSLEEIALSIVHENGKTLVDARGDVTRGIEVVEHACSISTIMMGETSENLSRNIDGYSYRVPLGVTAGICPFNFPTMIPLWMFPVSITCGNTMIMKPSEKVAGASNILAKILQDINLPKGVVNFVHGAHDTVNNICDHPKIKSISFVGSNQAGEYIHARGSKTGKRCQINMGAKNHGIIMPDADKEEALNALTGAAFGATGQRCMALSVAVMVGESANWIPELVERAKKLRVSIGTDKDVDLGPLCDAQVIYALLSKLNLNSSKTKSLDTLIKLKKKELKYC